MTETKPIEPDKQELQDYLLWCEKVVATYEPYRQSCELQLNHQCVELRQLYQEHLSVEEAVEYLRNNDEEGACPCRALNIPCYRCIIV